MKGVKIYHFSSEIIFGQLLLTFGDIFLVTQLEIKDQESGAKETSAWAVVVAQLVERLLPLPEDCCG